MIRYPVVRSLSGMVATPHYLASGVGLDVLRRGGTAVDAAIAANAVLNVVYPDMCSPGGDLFMLLYDARSRSLRGLNGSGRAPAKATIEYFTDRGMSHVPTTGPLSITVPGVVDAWVEALNAAGSLSLSDLLQPAIDYAEKGFPVGAHLSDSIALNEGKLRSSAEASPVYLPGGVIPKPGYILVQAELADSLRKIARGGREVFYRGEIAGAIASAVESQGGLLGEEDLAEHHSDWVMPLQTSYRGYDVFEFPPNSQGMTALMELNILEGFDVKSLGRFSADCLHLMVESKQLAFADRDRYICDADRVGPIVDRLLSKSYASQRRALINQSRAAEQYPSAGLSHGDTIYLCVVDRDGNAVSLIQSIFHAFGSGVVAGDTGIILQNRGSYFSLLPSHVNRIEPRKRTLHTLSPAMAMRNGLPYLVFGTMGGDGQPQTHLQVFSNIFDAGMGVQEAIEAPRWLSGRLAPGDGANVLFVESRFEEPALQQLAQRGHVVRPVGEWASIMGHAQGIMIDQKAGVLEGGADPRGDGLALGW